MTDLFGSAVGQQTAAYVAAGAAVLLAVILAIRAWVRRRPTAEELERRRRAAINQVGKMADGMVVDVGEAAISYSYDIRGVEYTTSQDISSLQDRLPSDRYSVAGPVAVKFDPHNPANSIILCEDWSGLRRVHGTHVQGINKES